MSAAAIEFDPEFRSADTLLHLRGAATYRHLGVFKVYTAALYLPPDAKGSDFWTEIPKRLEIAYLRPLSAADLVQSGDTFLRRNTTEAEYTRIQEDLDRVNSWYQDVERGDRYTLTYMPGKGTQLSLNGIEQGVIPGTDFARFYFRIWLGNNPVSQSVRDTLMGE